jgi:cytochrome c oxidase subunit 3
MENTESMMPFQQKATTGGPPMGGFKGMSTEKVAVYVLLAVASSMFMLFMLAYLIRSNVGDWDTLSQPWNPLSNRSQLWLNTAMLLCSSISFEYARRMVKAGNETGILRGLMLAGLFAVAFLIGQVAVWQQLIDQGYYLNTNPANSFFYMLTALHGAHLILGLTFWSNTMGRAWFGKSPAKVAKTTDMCATFWHFLFVLWLLLFFILAGPPETIALLATYCNII